MPFEIVEEPLDVARDDAIAVLDATRRHDVDVTRFQWLYCDNPDGPAVLWAIRKAETGEMAGFTVALPRRMLVNGEIVRAWNGADFSILPRFRTLGLAIKLRRAAKDGVDAGRVDFLYAHPNEKMAVIHGKVGHTPIGEMVRYAKVLKTAPYIERKVGSGALAAVGGAVMDPLLRFAGAESRQNATRRFWSGRISTHDSTNFSRNSRPNGGSWGFATPGICSGDTRRTPWKTYR